MTRDYYAILGVAKTSTDQEIKRAYRKIARELHPDVNPSNDAQHRFVEATTAYEVLSDPHKRKIVDLGGDPMEHTSGRGTQDPFAGFGGLGDIMDAFFGGAAGAGGRRARSHSQPGSDALLRIELTLEECATGVTKEITVDTAAPCDQCRDAGCRKCAGSRRMRRTVKARLPGGVGGGMRFRLPGEGDIGLAGGPAGDLYVQIDEAPHDVFQRHGHDLHCHLRIPMTTAALGATVRVGTLIDGEQELRLQPGIQSDTELIMFGKGMPKLRSSGRIAGRGNLHIHIDVDVPTKLDEEQRKLLDQLATLRGDDSPALAATGSTQADANGLFSRLQSIRRTVTDAVGEQLRFRVDVTNR